MAIGQHKLNTTTMHTTAVDLAAAFDASIRYGYTDDWIDPETWKEASYEFIELGRIERQGKPLCTLDDRLYTDRLRDPVKYEKSMICAFYGEHPLVAGFDIHHDCFYSDIHFDSRWWNFVRYF